MFTGIVEEIGTIDRIQSGRNSAVLHIRAKLVLKDVKVGDSIAVNGICLTVTSFHENGFTADVMHETLNRSALARLKPGSHVNLERAMAANGRFGGHLVAGHVDGTGKILRIQQDDNAVWYTIQAAPPVMRYIVEKGSITIDGISLTVAKTADRCFSISAIPHTAEVTTLKERRVGDLVNLETDIIGKYVEKFVSVNTGKSITPEFLAKYGF
ncbi:MAG: riboflavin synthase [Lachnospiraceae bacterium]|nr:riboflavin synthase [Lachnospiraceae bacterium]